LLASTAAWRSATLALLLLRPAARLERLRSRCADEADGAGMGGRGGRGKFALRADPAQAPRGASELLT
jgi:hypothetical protein